MRSPGSIVLCSLPLLWILATPALATDGVLEINETCAIQTGCFAGDTAGFPVTITESGSYRLTGNLTPAGLSANSDMIQINASYVRLDLNGFEVVHLQSCNGDPPTSCNISGGGTAIDGQSAQHVAVLNGVVRNGVANGIDLGFQITTLKRNVIDRNGGQGFTSLFGRNTLVENMVSQNALVGLELLSTDGYALNHFFNNSGNAVGVAGQVTGGINLGQNVCNSGLCF
jgi:hypothetical protein